MYMYLIIKSAGQKVFCAGHDLTELQTAAGRGQHQEIFDLCRNVMKLIREADVPVVCAVQVWIDHGSVLRLIIDLK